MSEDQIVVVVTGGSQDRSIRTISDFIVAATVVCSSWKAARGDTRLWNGAAA